MLLLLHTFIRSISCSCGIAPWAWKRSAAAAAADLSNCWNKTPAKCSALPWRILIKLCKRPPAGGVSCRMIPIKFWPQPKVSKLLLLSLVIIMRSSATARRGLLGELFDNALSLSLSLYQTRQLADKYLFCVSWVSFSQNKIVARIACQFYARE